MLRFAVSLAAVTAIAAPLAAAEVQIQSAGPVVELTITETINAEPDIATVSAGVTSEAKTAVEAMANNARAMAAVIARIEALGIDKKDVQTTGVSLNARYDYDRDTRKQIFRGYGVSNRVSVTLRDVKRTGGILDALVAAGATDINGPNFSIDDDTAAKAQARASAMQTARERALEYAGWAGYSDIRLLEVSETVSVSRPQPAMRGMFAASDAVQETPIAFGVVGTGVTVNVKYEMVK